MNSKHVLGSILTTIGRMLTGIVAMLLLSITFPLHPAQGGELEVDGDIEVTSAADGVRLNGGDFRPLGTGSDGVRWVDTNNIIQAHMHRFGAIDDRLYVTNNAGGNLTGVYLPSGGTNWVSTSDERLKFDVEPVTGILEKIRDIRVIEFNMAGLSVDPVSGEIHVDYNRPQRTVYGVPVKHEIGTIAQDWALRFPQVFDEARVEGTYHGVAYDRIGIIAIGAIQELEARVAELERLLEEARK